MNGNNYLLDTNSNLIKTIEIKDLRIK